MPTSDAGGTTSRSSRSARAMDAWSPVRPNGGVSGSPSPGRPNRRPGTGSPAPMTSTTRRASSSSSRTSWACRRSRTKPPSTAIRSIPVGRPSSGPATGSWVVWANSIRSSSPPWTCGPDASSSRSSRWPGCPAASRPSCNPDPCPATRPWNAIWRSSCPKAARQPRWRRSSSVPEASCSRACASSISTGARHSAADEKSLAFRLRFQADRTLAEAEVGSRRRGGRRRPARRRCPSPGLNPAVPRSHVCGMGPFGRL